MRMLTGDILPLSAMEGEGSREPTIGRSMEKWKYVVAGLDRGLFGNVLTKQLLPQTLQP